MGELFSAKKAPAPPNIVPPQSFIDQINGVKVSTTGGQTTIEQLPLTADQQAQKDQLNGILDQISSLSTGLAIDNPAFAPYVDAIRAQQAQVRGQAFGEASTALNNQLSKQGLSTGTAGDVQRGLLAQQMGQATSNDATSLYDQAETARTTLLGNQYNLLNAKNGLNQQNQANLTSAGYNLLGQQGDRYNLDNSLQLANYGAQLQAFSAQKQSVGSQLLNAGLTLGAAYLGGPAAGAAVNKATTAASTPNTSMGAGSAWDSAGFSSTPSLNFGSLVNSNSGFKY